MLRNLIYLYLPKTILALIILVATWLITKNIQRPLVALEKKGGVPQELTILINKVIKTVIYLIGIVMILAQLGVDVSTILASLGIGGLALSFALKDALTNIISGVIIIAYRPFVIGDHISLRTSSSGALLEGKVTDINFRYITIEAENSKILIPNSTAASNPVSVKR
jgi:small conductance mechanosensitive channel